MKKIIFMCFLVSGPVFSLNDNLNIDYQYNENYDDNFKVENLFRTLRENFDLLGEIHSQNTEILKKFYENNPESEVLMRMIEDDINSLSHSIMSGDFLPNDKGQKIKSIENILDQIDTSRVSLEFYLQSNSLHSEIKKYLEFFILCLEKLKHNPDAKLQNNKNVQQDTSENENQDDPNLRFNQQDDPNLRFNQQDDPNLRFNQQDDPNLRFNQQNDQNLRFNQQDDPNLRFNLQKDQSFNPQKDQSSSLLEGQRILQMMNEDEKSWPAPKINLEANLHFNVHKKEEQPQIVVGKEAPKTIQTDDRFFLPIKEVAAIFAYGETAEGGKKPLKTNNSPFKMEENF